MATILYDAEVFPYDWMFGFKILETEEYVQIWNDYTEIRRFMDSHKNDFFIGFNSNFYDDIILETVLKKIHPYDVSCRLIDHGEKMYSRMKLYRMDIMEGMAIGTSLKTIESELGMSIEETEVDFNIDRPLTAEEIEQTNKYNKHDLDATHVLLQHRWSNFVKTKMDLIRYFGLEPKMMQKPFATMVATGLGAKRTSHAPRHFEWYSNLIIENKEIRDFILEEKFLDENLVFEIDGVEHKMGLGGLHGAREAFHTNHFWKIDVKGYYSLIQMNLDLLSRSLPPEGKAAYKRLYDDRLERKKAKDPSADSLKAAVLAVWGATLNQYQLLSDITSGNLIMITGQAFMIDLLEKLEGHATIIQTNTDGIFIEPHDEDECRKIVDEWVKRTGFEVEFEVGTRLYQKDVNNYVCLVDDGRDGEIVAKGSYVNLYKMQDDNKFFEFKLTYNQSQGTIMDKAVVNYFIYDTPVEETVNNETNPRSFMFTVKKGARSYSHVEQHIYNNKTGETVIQKMGKVNRVFASKDPDFERRLYKIKNGNPNIFPNMDVNIFVFNKDLKEFTQDDMDRIDREYYIRRAQARIDDFITPKPQKVKKVKENKVKFKIYPSNAGVKEPELTVEEILMHIKKQPNGLFRVGDMQINRIGDWFTFVEKRGKTTVLSIDKLDENFLDAKVAKLRKEKIAIDRKQYFEIFERTLDALIVYTDKKEPNESFELEQDSFEQAFETLKGFGIIDEEVIEEVVSENEPKEVKRTTSKSKEVIKLDENYTVIYESYDMGRGTEWEAILLKNGSAIEKIDKDDVGAIFDQIEEWIKKYLS